MENKGKVRFIRKNGRLIPIREKKDGNVDKRHISQKGLSEAASRSKPKSSHQAKGSLLGSLAGTFAGYKKGGLIGGALGFTVGGLVGKGLGSIRVIDKQEAANRLKKVKAIKKKSSV